MKKKRQQKILEIIENNIVITQDEIQNTRAPEQRSEHCDTMCPTDYTGLSHPNSDNIRYR